MSLFDCIKWRLAAGCVLGVCLSQPSFPEAARDLSHPPCALTEGEWPRKGQCEYLWLQDWSAGQSTFGVEGGHFQALEVQEPGSCHGRGRPRWRAVSRRLSQQGPS